MSDDFGTGVSRTLSALQRQFTHVIRQAGKPPLDAEENLQASIHNEQIRQLVQSNTPSGFLGDTVNPLRDFVTNENWSNFFHLGRPGDTEEPVVWAVVNGWVVPVTGTALDGVANRVRLYPAPETDARIDLVFLEVFKAQVAPPASTINKPTSTTIWAYGNVEYGGANLPDDLEDPNIGYETTERVQLQYRLRVVGQGAGAGTGVALDVYPEGLGDPTIYGQGTADDPITGLAFTNMGETLGDPGLWRAGDGDPSNALGTTDGYVYAVPVAAIFRRNSTSFVAVSAGGGNPNQNGAYDRNRSAAFLTDPRSGAKVFTNPTLTAELDELTTGMVSITDLAGSPLADSQFLTDLASETQFLVIGEGLGREIVEISAVDTTSSPTTITIASRGRGGTEAKTHAMGSSFSIYNSRPEGLYADQIADQDILDMRHFVTLGEFDYRRLLLHNLDQLFKNRLVSSYKQNGTGGDTQGHTLMEVSYLWNEGNDSSKPNHTELLDGPDGVRTVFSDSAVPQSEIATLLDPTVALNSGFTATTFNDGASWDVDPGFQPSGWLNDSSTPGWSNGSVIFMHIGGANGSQGARGSFRSNDQGSVRFVTPREYWTGGVEPDEGATPVTLRFLDQVATLGSSSEDTSLDDRPGPMYPLEFLNFEKPFLVLGGILADEFLVTGVDTTTDITNGSVAGRAEIDLGIDFDSAGVYYPSGNVTSLDTEGVSSLLLNSTRTLYDMLTNGGLDETGQSSEVYLVIYGDDGAPENNGAFRVLGAGTVGYTFESASNSTSVVVEGVTQGFTGFTATGTSMTVQLRSQYSTAQDGNGLASGRSAMAVVITDLQAIEGGEANPWNAANTGSASIPSTVTSKAVIGTTIQYGPSRGGFARVPREIVYASARTTGNEFLRQPVGLLDSDFASRAPYPTDQVEYDAAHIQLWNRLGDSSLKRPAHYAENAREHELLVDGGSRTLVFRPFQNKAMTVQDVTALSGSDSLIGDPSYALGTPSAGVLKDGAQIFTTGSSVQRAIPVPQEYMPRFGRQDIPYHVGQGGTDPYLSGINHLFTDSTDVATDDVFSIIGGPPAAAAGEVTPMLFQTGTSSGLLYGEYGNITNPFHPGYQARLVELSSEVSKDTGTTLRGIQLPPYLGVCRLYGIYERDDYLAATAGDTVAGGFEADRVTPKSGGPTNLIRTDAKHQTLFILRDGAEDVTESKGDHTYVVPESALDLQRIPSYGVSGNTTFEDFEYVVECTVFGFARGFISENNFVLTRRLTQNGVAPVAGVELTPNMTLPAAAPSGTPIVVAFDRTVYQGDPYMTRDGETRQVADYSHRYGQIDQDDAYEIRFPVQQYDENGDQVVERINPRALEILASADFYTTLGSGKIGGMNFDASPVDAGFLMGGDRLPETPNDPPYETRTRTFTSVVPNTNATASMLIISAPLWDRNSDNVSDVVARVAHPDMVMTWPFSISTSVSLLQFTEDFVNAWNSSPLSRLAIAIGTGNSIVQFYSRVRGESGNDVEISFAYDDRSSGLTGGLTFLPLIGARNRLSTFLTGGSNFSVRAGDGDTNVELTGLTERLPLGILVQDSDFLGESPEGPTGGTLYVNEGTTSPGACHPIDTTAPYSDVFFGSGEHLMMVDGAIKRYAAFGTANPTGTKRFRTYRGGSVAMLSGDLPCGPVRWNSGWIGEDSEPVLKGAVLAGKALLVKNYKEEAFTTSSTGRVRSYGGEIQLVILTYAVYGNPDTTNTLEMIGQISPTGYGDGYAAADRYRLYGKPLEYNRSQSDFDLTKELVPYNPNTNIRVEDICP